MRNNPRARLVIRLRKLVFLLPIALPAGVVVSVDLSQNLIRKVPARWMFVIPFFGIAFPGWLILTIFVSARATVRLLRVRPQTNKAVAIPAILLGLVVFAAYSGLGILLAVYASSVLARHRF